MTQVEEIDFLQGMLRDAQGDSEAFLQGMRTMKERVIKSLTELGLSFATGQIIFSRWTAADHAIEIVKDIPLEP
jgi:hypothetical protein